MWCDSCSALLRHAFSRVSFCISPTGIPQSGVVNPNAVAGNARLRDLEQSVIDAISVADADLIVAEIFHSEILAELTKGKIAAAKKLLPVAIRLDLVDHHRALFAAVTGNISLSISVEV
jgi:hypothetical protein